MAYITKTTLHMARQGCCLRYAQAILHLLHLKNVLKKVQDAIATSTEIVAVFFQSDQILLRISFPGNGERQANVSDLASGVNTTPHQTNLHPDRGVDAL